ncbi:MAG: MGMT family protein [Nanoarchaeota archaeon]|nr:MGMT family protein [Nanoarchaeota archaeon]
MSSRKIPLLQNNYGKVNVQSFNERCYALLRRVPLGKITTYKALAQALGTKAYRAVGNAMNKNPYSARKILKSLSPEASLVPCHRVIKSDGTLGGFAYGSAEKTKLLKSEGVEIFEGKIDLNKYFFAPKGN